MKALTLLIALCISFSVATAQTGWNKQSIPTTQYLPDIFFINKDTGWVGCLDGVFRTTDGGNVWTKISDQLAAGIVFVNNKLGYGNADSTRYIVRTLDGGFTWEKIRIPMKEFPSQIMVFGADTVYIYSKSDKFCRSIDSCKTWEVIDISSTAGGSYFVNGSIGFACGDIESWFGDFPPTQGTQGPTFEYTIDGGRTWGRRFPFIEGTDSLQWVGGDFRVLTVTSSGQLFVADASSIYTSTNSGLSWDQKLKQVSIGDIWFTSPSTGFAVGYWGKIYHTSDTGNSWSEQESTVSTMLYGVVFVDSLTGWACGELGVIIHTTDGGKLWTRQYLPKPLTTSVSPEPFGRKTSITYELPSAMKVKKRIYDILGKELEVLESPGILDAGTHTIEFDGSRYPEGTFHYQIETEGFYGTGKMTKVVY